MEITKRIPARIALRLISALLIAAVLWRAGMSLDFKRIEKSRSSVSNEFLPIDEVVKLVDEKVASTGSVAYVVEDVNTLDGLDRSAFAAVAFRILPRRLSLVGVNHEKMHSDYVLIDNYSPDIQRLVGAKAGYREIGRTRSTSLYARIHLQCIVNERGKDWHSPWLELRQIASACMVAFCVCVLFAWLSGMSVRIEKRWVFAFAATAAIMAIGCLLTHTLRSPNGTAVYAGKAKLLFLTGGLPIEVFSNDDWKVFLPTYPIGLTLLTWLYYTFAGGCDNWIVQIVAYSGVVATAFLLLNSFRTTLGKIAALLFLVSVGSKQISAGFYPEGFMAAAILAAMMRIRSGDGDVVTWIIAGMAAMFKNEGLVFYCILFAALRLCGMKHLCRISRVVVGMLPAVVWQVFVRVSDGGLDGYALNGICTSVAHASTALLETATFVVKDWKGGIAVIPVFMICCLASRVVSGRRMRGFTPVVFFFVAMALCLVPLVYCFCSTDHIRWRIHSSCFRLLWTVAAVSLFGMTLFEYRVRAWLRIRGRRCG